MQFLDSIDVVKVGEARRYYITGVVTNVMTNEVKYSVRVSDDEAMTWTDDVYDIAQFGPEDKFAEFGIVAIHPTNPDLIVGRVWRKQLPDTLVYSEEKGKAGSWKLLAEPTEVDSVTYTPEGVLYFGDSDQKSKGVWTVEKPGDAPKLLSDTWKPTCLGWDEANKRLLGCGNFYLFGEVDVTSGELKPLLDLRCAEHMVDCPGQEAMAMVCEPQAQADFCHLSHWVIAPVCEQYDRGPELATYAASQTFMCVDGFGVAKAEGAPTGAAGGGGTGTTTMGVGTAGMSAPTATAGAQAQSSAGTGGSSPTTTTEPKSSGGCSTVPGSSAERFSALLLGLGLVSLARRRRRAH
jgi:MYXO-CTERM domain-containing protein